MNHTQLHIHFDTAITLPHNHHPQHMDTVMHYLNEAISQNNDDRILRIMNTYLNHMMNHPVTTNRDDIITTLRTYAKTHPHADTCHDIERPLNEWENNQIMYNVHQKTSSPIQELSTNELTKQYHSVCFHQYTQNEQLDLVKTYLYHHEASPSFDTYACKKATALYARLLWYYAHDIENMTYGQSHYTKRPFLNGDMIRDVFTRTHTHTPYAPFYSQTAGELYNDIMKHIYSTMKQHIYTNMRHIAYHTQKQNIITPEQQHLPLIQHMETNYDRHIKNRINEYYERTTYQGQPLNHYTGFHEYLKDCITSYHVHGHDKAIHATLQPPLSKRCKEEIDAYNAQQTHQPFFSACWVETKDDTVYKQTIQAIYLQRIRHRKTYTMHIEDLQAQTMPIVTNASPLYEFMQDVYQWHYMLGSQYYPPKGSIQPILENGKPPLRPLHDYQIGRIIECTVLNEKHPIHVTNPQFDKPLIHQLLRNKTVPYYTAMILNYFEQTPLDMSISEQYQYIKNRPQLEQKVIHYHESFN